MRVIQYQDDLYLVESLALFLADASRLNADPDIVGESVLGAIRAVDTAIRRMRDLIMDNEHLVERLEYLRLLSRAARTSGEAISELIRPDCPLAKIVASSADELNRAASAHKAMADELSDALNAALERNGGADEDLVSGDEISELLRMQ